MRRVQSRSFLRHAHASAVRNDVATTVAAITSALCVTRTTEMALVPPMLFLSDSVSLVALTLLLSLSLPPACSDVVADRAWLWTHPAGFHDNYFTHAPFTSAPPGTYRSRITPTEAAEARGAPGQSCTRARRPWAP